MSEIRCNKVSVIVYTENPKERQKYFNLFKFIFQGQITKEIQSSDRKEFETYRFRFRFYPKLQSARGYKAHYVLNLTQDIEFHQCVALPNTSMFDSLKRDKQWQELFEDMGEL